MAKKKVTLRAVGDFFRNNVTLNTAWVTLDCSGIRVFDNKGGGNNPPVYDKDKRIWTSEANKLIAVISIAESHIMLRDYLVGKKLDYSACIECIDPTLTLDPSGRKKRRGKSAVLAIFADGTKIRFDSKVEAKNFFGFKRAEEVTRLIETGFPLPDGTTYLDEALD